MLHIVSSVIYKSSFVNMWQQMTDGRQSTKSTIKAKNKHHKTHILITVTIPQDLRKLGLFPKIFLRSYENRAPA